ncbi:hypothetical protein SAMN04487897_109169 [Paenibacillus sp. yr247]|uniref:hypothetical protein n=1 Tax=Paenibacillus sp. yr247 TaxID=1761880 RepID=UPI0008833E76|nr:hypothetical protein [Paenibacillus sp. yr247]SDO19418.1 hypothetical protein SAMN04487897_109169 [Paenibacillus sp. yr247]
MKVKLLYLWFTLILMFLFLGTESVYAAINWTPNTVTQIYDPSSGGGQYYAYAPTAIIDGSTERYWTCHNSTSGVIKDSIWYTERVSGSIVTNQEAYHASTNSGDWDSYHVCDPTVVAGTFKYQNTNYAYALFYTGNDINGSTHNQIGVAFANQLTGPWTRYPGPIIKFTNTSYWGVGQPSATAVSGGRVLLFFTRGISDADTHVYRSDIDLSNMDNSPPSIDMTTVPSPTDSVTKKLSETGLKRTDGTADYLNNVDMVYDGSRDRFYAVREQHPYPADYPNYIGKNTQIISMIGSDVWNGTGSWTTEGTINPDLTGITRNHNAGLERNVYGGLPNSSALRAVFTSSCSGTGCNVAEWTYKLWEVKGTLVNGAADNVLLSSDAIYSGNASNWGTPRGSIQELMYDSVYNKYLMQGDWNEYGVPYGLNIGKITEANALYWQASWSSSKQINYFSAAGSYPNQPQPYTMWKIEYKLGSTWTTLASGQGGWMNSGIFTWGGQGTAPITLDAIRVKIYSDGVHDVVSPDFRGRGGLSNQTNDTATTPKASVAQLLQ